MSVLFSSLIDAPEPPTHRLPVTVLTGFLGSGKTTLLNRLLSDPALKHTAVLINEFGAVGLDHDLVQHTEENLVLLANGCICCTIRSDLVSAFEQLTRDPRVRSGQIERVVLETTGLADPAPILHTLMADPRVTPHFALAGVLCTVDAFNGAATLDCCPEALKQVAVADALALTKTELCGAQPVQTLRKRLQAINPTADTVAGSDAALARLRALAHTPAAPGLDVDGGGASAAPVYRPVPAAPDATGTPHSDAIQTFTVVRDTPLSREGFFAWLDLIASMRGNDLLRVKGLVQLVDSPDQPLVIHGVQHLFHPPQTLARWPSEDRRTRIVFITRDIDRDSIEATLSVFQNRRQRA
jgi:G3E family GTPase